MTWSPPRPCRSRAALLSWLVLTVLVSALPARAENARPPVARRPKVELSIRNEALHSIDLGLDWLRRQQAADGSWGRGYPAITALATTAFLRSPTPLAPEDRSTAEHGLEYLATMVRPDGGIYPEKAPQMQSYNTSICLMALIAADDPAYDAIIRKARAFLVGLQADEARGYGPDSVFYGGIGYGDNGRPDLSNLQWSLEALKVSQDYAPHGEATNQPRDDSRQPSGALKSESGQGLFWDKAIVFLQRCQNRTETNELSWAGTDGGFEYNPEESKAGGHTSYGSMTYAGMKSFIYAGVGREDPRVKAAFAWCSRNYDLEQNPEMGQQGLYYYYHTMAKALDAHGDDSLVDAKTKRHNWRNELIVKLVSLQQSDGLWKNSVGRWWENDPQLVTSYCVLTLEETSGNGLTSAYPTGTPR
jgi:squalene-hopene/tetraprenyl-beta-curcumene cyclase